MIWMNYAFGFTIISFKIIKNWNNFIDNALSEVSEKLYADHINGKMFDEG